MVPLVSYSFVSMKQSVEEDSHMTQRVMMKINNYTLFIKFKGACHVGTSILKKGDAS